MATGNKRNTRTTHPKIRSRRERALARIDQKRNTEAAQIERAALVRKLAQRKQGSAA